MLNWRDEVQEKSFIDSDKIHALLNQYETTSDETFDQVMEKVKTGVRLELEEVAMLIGAKKPEQITEIFKTAKAMKERVYGNRVVIFAPLYLGNKCTNHCTYCGFKCTNTEIVRKTLTISELEEEVKVLEEEGHKRLILVYGTHPDYSAEYIAETVKKTYSVKHGKGEIRRVNINAAPYSVEEFKIIKEANIGTFQIFQETYHEPTYQKVHPKGEKSNFKWRLFGLDRAQEAGLDDVGIGALFGLYDWRFEVLGLMSHVIHLEERFNVGPHTISFPRINEAIGNAVLEKNIVSDDDFKRIIAILRLAVPYTGLILTARETAEMRRECMELGVSQIDAGTQIELQGYTKHKIEQEQDLAEEQFFIADARSLDEILCELMEMGFVPSFCTACYRLGRTGEHFMEFSKPGFIHQFCSPNAILTLYEYIQDYGSEKTKKVARELIEKELEKPTYNEKLKITLRERMNKIEQGSRDLYY